MEDLLNLVISDPIDFDESLFCCWLEGRTPEESLEIKLDLYRAAIRTNSNINRNATSLTNRKIGSPWTEDDTNADSRVIAIDNQLTDLIRHDILDQYHIFEILEHYICLPSLLLSKQTMFQIPTLTQYWIIEKYYQLDDIVVRELLGRKMTKNRK